MPNSEVGVKVGVGVLLGWGVFEGVTVTCSVDVLGDGNSVLGSDTTPELPQADINIKKNRYKVNVNAVRLGVVIDCDVGSFISFHYTRFKITKHH